MEEEAEPDDDDGGGGGAEEVAEPGDLFSKEAVGEVEHPESLVWRGEEEEVPRQVLWMEEAAEGLLVPLLKEAEEVEPNSGVGEEEVEVEDLHEKEGEVGLQNGGEKKK